MIPGKDDEGERRGVNRLRERGIIAEIAAVLIPH
jgi:hypothetical protein